MSTLMLTLITLMTAAITVQFMLKMQKEQQTARQRQLNEQELATNLGVCSALATVRCSNPAQLLRPKANTANLVRIAALLERNVQLAESMGDCDAVSTYSSYLQVVEQKFAPSL